MYINNNNIDIEIKILCNKVLIMKYNILMILVLLIFLLDLLLEGVPLNDLIYADLFTSFISLSQLTLKEKQLISNIYISIIKAWERGDYYEYYLKYGHGFSDTKKMIILQVPPINSPLKKISLPDFLLYPTIKRSNFYLYDSDFIIKILISELLERLKIISRKNGVNHNISYKKLFFILKSSSVYYKLFERNLQYKETIINIIGDSINSEIRNLKTEDFLFFKKVNYIENCFIILTMLYIPIVENMLFNLFVYNPRDFSEYIQYIKKLHIMKYKYKVPKFPIVNNLLYETKRIVIIDYYRD
jgi:hypothetical protein